MVSTEKGQATQAAANFAEFWPHYLAAHADPRTRAVHYGGTVLGCMMLIGFAATGSVWPLLAAPILGYGPAWLAHRAFEGNRPATFEHGLWSLLADFRMLWMAGTGDLTAELQRLGLA